MHNTENSFLTSVVTNIIKKQMLCRVNFLINLSSTNYISDLANTCLKSICQENVSPTFFFHLYRTFMANQSLFHCKYNRTNRGHANCTISHQKLLYRYSQKWNSKFYLLSRTQRQTLRRYYFFNPFQMKRDQMRVCALPVTITVRADRTRISRPV